MKNRIKGIIIVRENTDKPPEMIKINGFIRFVAKVFIVFFFGSIIFFVFAWSIVYNQFSTDNEIKKRNDSLFLYSRQIDTLKMNLTKANRFFEYFKMVSSFDNKNDLPPIDSYIKDTISFSSASVNEAQQEFKDIPRIRPVTGVISRGFDLSIPHEAVDFVAPFRGPIRATANGIVAKIYFDEDMGNVVALKHKDGYESLYAHCQEIIVKEGENVVQGETIAFVGNSGKSSKGIHLHYEVSKDGKIINPEQLFW
jgi:murein DD-endopeptidase MepM/ murein hydrolase activator NlpD